MTVTIRHGDCREVLRTMADESVHCCVTSPPYWGLRDYGVAGQIGLEQSMHEHINILVELFGEVRRVLRKDGTLWINYGDAYCSTDKWGGGGGNTGKQTVAADGAVPSWQVRQKRQPQVGLKPKDRMMLPARLAIALCDDGWWLRDEIVWHKPNPMPSSVKDRTTPAHEMIYLLSKSPRYYWNFEAMQEAASINTHARTAGKNSGVNVDRVPVSRKIKVPGAWDLGPGGHGTINRSGRTSAAYKEMPGVTPKSAPEDSLVKAKGSFHASTTEVLPFRNKRSVWTVASAAFAEAHFATFPPALIEPCVLAGCPAGGIVLDPFGGSGTTALVADRLGRDAIIIELNPEYAAIAERRLNGDAGMFAEVSTLSSHVSSPTEITGE
jgi:DNA modification methylase